MTRRTTALGVALLALVALTGCSEVTPYGVANHDEKWAFHQNAALEVLETSVFDGIAATENFASVGYAHVETGGGDSMHVRVETTVWGTTYVTQRAPEIEHGTIDTIHIGGSPRTYYLFGDAYLPATGTPWVSFEAGDIGRSQQELCLYRSVSILCDISESWTITQDTFDEDIPVQVEVNADGSRHVTSVVTFSALNESGLFSITPELLDQLGEDLVEGFIPLHVWLDPNGVVTKVEVNGQLESSGETLQVQFGFELTGTPDEAQKPTDPATIDQAFVTPIASSDVERFWMAIDKIRFGS